jgi:hypothetical protein
VSCGSVHACPVCSERIWAARQDELSRLLTAAHDAGFTVSMLTFTVRHTAGDALSAQLDALNEAWTAAQNSTATARAKRDAGFVGMVRRLEITDGAHGWHPHLHALVIHRHAGAAAALGATMHRAFVARLRRFGVESWATSGGLDARELTLGQALAEVASYVTKGTYEALDPARAAREVSGGRGKRGRGASRSHWQNLDLAVAGDRRCAARVHEYERATKGRRALTWTGAVQLDGEPVALTLRDRFLSEPERSDEEIAADNDGDQTAVALFTASDWSLVRRDAAMVDLLEVVETAAPDRRFDAVVAYLDARGFRVVPWRPPPDPATVSQTVSHTVSQTVSHG